MPSLILHHYQTSPFSEKVRLVLGAKGEAWQSVIVPVMLPKPDVVALTGGYRRTPFLQVGADIYCDSALMCRVIDAVAPEPPLYPAASAGLAEIVAQWADAQLFWIAVPYTIQPISVPYMFPGATPDFMKAFAMDRAAMTPNMKRASLADGAAQLRGYLARLEAMLADGRRFLLGGAACIADFSVAQSIWFMRRSPPVAAMLDAYPGLLTWFARVVAFGHGTATEISSQAAIEVAAGAGGFAATAIDVDGGFAAGDSVTVTPTDYAHDPVAGTLVGLTCDEVVVERTDARAGRVRVHFPRAGFQVSKD
jgi:glutathione S-transferase